MLPHNVEGGTSASKAENLKNREARHILLGSIQWFELRQRNAKRPDRHYEPTTVMGSAFSLLWCFDITECSFFPVKEGLRTFLRMRVNFFGHQVDGDKIQQKLQRLPVPSCSKVLFFANWPVIACAPRTYNRPTATSMAKQAQRLKWVASINAYVLSASASRLHVVTQQMYRSEGASHNHLERINLKTQPAADRKES